MRTCTRRLEFDAAHRVMRHESKCVNLHGHRYAAEITCLAEQLDDLGRVIDFGHVKALVGDWIDSAWDHGCILNVEDEQLVAFVRAQGWKVWTSSGNPTAENMATWLRQVSGMLLRDTGIIVERVRLYETPNGWADSVRI